MKTSCHTIRRLMPKPQRRYTAEWNEITWVGPQTIMGEYVWTDGTNIYHSNGNNQFVLNGDAWETKTWTGHSSIYGTHFWTDGTEIYYTYDSKTYVVEGSTFTDITTSMGASGLQYGSRIWTDGKTIYYSQGTTQKAYLSGWVDVAWNGLANFDATNIWTDGNNIYYSDGSNQCVLSGDCTWEAKSWNKSIAGKRIWSDGVNIYHSYNKNNYVLNGDTWEAITFDGLNDFEGERIWTDGNGVFYSWGTGDQYSLTATVDKFYLKGNGVWSEKELRSLLRKNNGVWENISRSDLPAGVKYRVTNLEE